MIFLRYFVFVIIYLFGKNDAQYSKNPDITVLTQILAKNKYKITCVAGSSVDGSAITFITPLKENYLNFTPVSIYKTPQGRDYPKDNFKCNFYKTSACLYYWGINSGRAVTINSLRNLHDLAPVTDERWENFRTYFSDNDNLSTINLNGDEKCMGISVRTSGEANILLCSKDIVCYKLTLNENIGNNQYRTALRRCTKNGCDFFIHGKGVTCSEQFWSHVKIYFNDGLLAVKGSKSNEIYLQFNMPVLANQLVLFISEKGKGLWKVHEYSYLSLYEAKSWFSVGNDLKVDKNGRLCVALYVATCKHCIISLILNEHQINVRGVYGKNTQPWQYIKLMNTNETPGKTFKLKVSTSSSYESGFWLIDDARTCYQDETRIIVKKTDMEENNVISCQTLHNPDWWSSYQNKALNQLEFDVTCPSKYYTGSNCAVSCVSATGTACEGIIVCEPNQNVNSPICTCVSGYYGSYCETGCPLGSYGSECKYMCDPCKGFCQKSTGQCLESQKCSLNDEDRGCLIKMNAPHNISLVWTEGKTKLFWYHPRSKVENVVSFSIEIEMINTVLFDHSSFNLKTIYNVPIILDMYSYEISESLPLSSSYLVKIQTNSVKNIGNKTETQKFSSPPVMPRFTDSLIAEYDSDTTQNITIPAADPTTITKNSSLYILVCNDSSVTDKMLTDFHLKLKSWIGCKGNFWIAAQLFPEKSESYFVVGNSENNPSNIELDPSVIYKISAVFFNEYDGQILHVALTTETESSSSSNSALYALLLLLLFIPVILWFVYKKIKQNKAESETSVHYQAVPTEQYNTPINTTINKNTVNDMSKKVINKNVNIFKSKNNSKYPFEAIKVNNFSQYVKESLEKNELSKQFELLPEDGTKPWTVGTKPENIKKNRYKNLTAYDHSRVILTKLPEDPSSDFINANYIDGYKQKNAYIATQGPKELTVNDFWRMIWQENVQLIVMMTNLFEEGKFKCAQYWPDIEKTKVYGKISVTFMKTDIYADFEYRTLKIEHDNTVKEIQQYHYTSWPDHGVPLYAQSLVPFLKKILQISTATAPIVVHCSAGVGRTGTIILADICLRMAAVEGEINVRKYLHDIREQRVNMVASYDQYLLVHMVLLECLLTPETNFSCNKLSEKFEELLRNDGIKKQIRYLKDSAWHNQIMRNSKPDNINISKNRFPEIIPEGRRIYLSKYPIEDESSTYINAVPVDGFRLKDPFIVTQNPLPHTIKDFWRMVSEFNVKLIVSLNEMKYNDMNYQFWPSENEEITPLPFITIKYASVASSEIYDIYKITLEDKHDNETKYVRILQFKNWPRDKIIPEKESDLITLIDTQQKLSREGYPVVITCFDGATACGLYVSLSFIIEKIKLEQICNVCLAVRTVRNNREQFILNNEQFEYLYKSAIRYISTFDIYSNFN